MAGRSDKELIANGYMTPSEFVDRLVPGLKEYLKHNWGCKPDDLYHPEDLFSNAAIYLEVARHVVGNFGVQPSEKAQPVRQARGRSREREGALLRPFIFLYDAIVT